MLPNLKTREQKLCPEKFTAYKGSCYYHGKEVPGDFDHNEHECAKVGSRLITIKERATYQFIRAWAIRNRMGDFYLGINFTYNPIYYHHNESDPNVTSTLYVDGTVLTSQKIMLLMTNRIDLVLKSAPSWRVVSTTNLETHFAAKRWIKFVNGKVSELFIKLWHHIFLGPTCPSDFTLHPTESDGRTCYSVTTGSTGPNQGLESRCRGWPSGPDSYLRRPGLPAKKDIIDILRPGAK